MTKKYRIGILSGGNPYDLKEWSGITANMIKTFTNAGHEVVALGPYRPKMPFFIKLISFVHNLFRLGVYFPDQHILYRKKIGNYFEEKLKGQSFDFLWAPSSATEASLIKTSIPIVYTADATFASMIDYYFMGLSDKTIKEGNQTNQEAMDNASLIVFPSDWAINSAINDYHIPKNKLFKLDFGANLQQEISNIQPKSLLSEKVKFVFLGVDWERKGGQIVIETLTELHTKGIEVSLTIIGCNPNLPKLPYAVTIYPFLKKSNQAEYSVFSHIMNDSHFLFLPTRKECYGIAFCEACAFGLPSITTDTGGVSSIIKQNENGFILPTNASIHDYTQQIVNLLNLGQDEYLRISNNARKAYEERLNWQTFANKFIKLYEQHSSKI